MWREGAKTKSSLSINQNITPKRPRTIPFKSLHLVLQFKSQVDVAKDRTTFFCFCISKSQFRRKTLMLEREWQISSVPEKRKRTGKDVFPSTLPPPYFLDNSSVSTNGLVAQIYGSDSDIVPRLL
ncbi:hypothetical protein TNCV_80441 [Trichonephila clavipes]|nr:hypothetical protein TNCV_80441 [Trichonephila clavipes]